MEPIPPEILTYSYTLLHNRLVGLSGDLAADAEAAERGERTGGDSGARALGAIILADAAVEISINHLAESAFPPRGMMPTYWPVHHFAFERLGKVRAPFERLKAVAAMMRLAPEWDAEPWVSLRDLHVVRNALAHYESAPVRSNDPRIRTFPNEDKLRPIAQRMGTWAKYEGGGTWLEAFLNAKVARWAHDTARVVLGTLDSDAWRRRVPIPPSDLSYPAAKGE